MNKKLIASASAILLALPVLSLAFVPPAEPKVITPTVQQLLNILFSIFWPVAVAIVVVTFALAAFIFLTAQGDPGKIATARTAVIWGVVGAIVLVLAFSIVNFALVTTGT